MSNIKKLLPVFMLLMTFPLFAQIPVSTCMSTLNVAGGHYILTTDLNCNNTAAFLSADDVIFDLHDHTITATGGFQGAAIITVDYVTTPHACTVTTGVQIHHGIITGFGTGISLCAPTPSTGISNAEIHHMTLIGNGRGIALYNAKDTNIHNNVISDSRVIPPNPGDNPTGIGIYLAGSNENQIKNNTLRNNASAGILLEFASNDNTIMSNSIVNTAGAAVFENGIVLSGIYLTFAGTQCVDNIVKNNDAFGSVTDLKDGNGSCELNLWKNNKYNTKDPPCIQ